MTAIVKEKVSDTLTTTMTIMTVMLMLLTMTIITTHINNQCNYSLTL